ncbi:MULTISPECIES: zinc transporter ZntB [Actibacterium]|uniref:Zinc transporter n=1 Tax=Actibacterium naphthalenivorans TaxID=1614693 RepID=A0A840CDB2_9RHOB|nr:MULTISPECIES: zinc transporter ZntB [Actibacterium]ALG90182.1 magnesium transporter [Actibacterium sp. EMB200-NS6]MBB4022072.1 zinc transporter [Actibacterium naphthalenivorans]
MAHVLSPLAAFDIAEDGRASPVAEDWPAAAPRAGARWRWLHLDVTNPAMAGWAAEHLPEVGAAALSQPETRPRCDALGAGLILNLRGVNMNPGQESDDMVSLRMWVGEALIVSARVRKVFAVDALRQAALAGHAPPTPDAFLLRLTEGLTDRIEAVSLALEDATDTLEEEIFDHDRFDADALAPTRRKVIRLRRYIGPQREALNRLAQSPLPLIGPEMRPMLAETANRATRAVEELDAVSARLAALQEHVNAELSARMGRNGYVLSVVAAIFLPLGFFTGLFGVNLAGIPGTAAPHAFAVLTVMLSALGLGLFALFRWRKWL